MPNACRRSISAAGSGSGAGRPSGLTDRDPHDHPGHEAVHQRFAELLDHLRMVVRRHDDLPAHGFDCVKRVQEFFLRRLLAGQEMHVVDDQQIDAVEFSARHSVGSEATGPNNSCWSRRLRQRFSGSTAMKWLFA